MTVAEMAMRRPVPVPEAMRVALRAYTALAMMSDGTARKDEWQDLADQCNIVEALVEMGKLDARTVTPQVEAAIAGLVVAMKCPPGMMRMGSAIQAMREVVALHEDAVVKFSAQTMCEATERVCRKIYTARNDPTVTVVE